MGSEYQALTVQSKKRKKIITKVSTFILEYLTRIYLNSYALHVMKEDTMLEIVLRTKMALSRRKETREDIMLMLQKMMNLPQKGLSKKVTILQVMKNMI